MTAHGECCWLAVKTAEQAVRVRSLGGEVCSPTQAGALAPDAQDAASMFAPGERLSADSTGMPSTRGSQRTGTAPSSLVETPKLGGGSQPASSSFGRQTPDPTPGSSPRGPSDFQDVGMSLQRSSRNDLRAMRCVQGGGEL